MLAWSILAQANPKSGATLELLWTILILMAVVLASAVLIITLGRWTKRPPLGAFSAGDELSLFRALYERGECSREEYDRIRAKLGRKIRGEVPQADSQPQQPALHPPDEAIRPGNSQLAAGHAGDEDKDAGAPGPDSSRNPA